MSNRTAQAALGAIVGLMLFLVMALPIVGDTGDGAYYLRDGSRSLTGAMNAAGHQIRNVGDATAGGDALNRQTGDDRYVNATGDAMTGDLDLGGNAVTNVATVQAVDGAESGVFRLPNDGWLTARNAADSGDVNLWRVNSSDDIEAGADVDLGGQDLTDVGAIQGVFVERHATFVQSGDVSTVMDIENIRVYADNAQTIQDVRCSVNTAPTTSAVTVDVLKNGTTIFTTTANRPSIAAGGNTDVSGTPDTTALASGDYLTIDIVAEDTGDTASDLVCQVRVREALYGTD